MIPPKYVTKRLYHDPKTPWTRLNVKKKEREKNKYVVCDSPIIFGDSPVRLGYLGETNTWVGVTSACVCPSLHVNLLTLTPTEYFARVIPHTRHTRAVTNGKLRCLWKTAKDFIYLDWVFCTYLSQEKILNRFNIHINWQTIMKKKKKNSLCVIHYFYSYPFSQFNYFRTGILRWICNFPLAWTS